VLEWVYDYDYQGSSGASPHRVEGADATSRFEVVRKAPEI
jgi:hypothetical protein